jgi:hypothetical protein
MKNFVIAKKFKTRIDADLAKTLLDANNIFCYVSSDDEGGVAPFPFSPTCSGAKIFVKKQDYKKAIGLLKS